MLRSRLVVAPTLTALLVACTSNASKDSARQQDRQPVAVTFDAAPNASPSMVERVPPAAMAAYSSTGSPRPGRSGSRTEPYPSAAVRDADADSAGLTGDVSGALRDVDVGSGAKTSLPDPSALPTDATAPMIVRTGSATLKVDSLVPAIARLRVLAQHLGGYTGTTTIDVGTKEAHSATVELKVPSTRWSELLDGVKPIGVLEHQEETTADVGEEYVDVGARVANAQRTEARLVDLLARRTGKLADIVAVEQELSSVREEIERYEGRMRYLRAHAAMSTMTVSVHEPIPIVANAPGERPIADAFGTAWHLFVGAVALFVASLGITIPLGVIVALVWWLRRGGARARFAD